MKRMLLLAVVIVFAGVLYLAAGSAAGGLKDGYFSAEMSAYHDGWKEFVTICVKGGAIVSVEYNAKNESGFIKSWDMAYMRDMNEYIDNYPNRYTREYAKQVMEKQSAEGIDTVSGATRSGVSFRQLIEAVVNMSRSGKNELVIVSAQGE